MEVSHGSSSNLWIRPRTGEICLGPAGPSLNRGIFTLRGVISQNVPHPEPSPLPLSMYSNLTFTDNMVKNTSSEFVLNALFKECMWTHPVSIANYDYYNYIWSSSRRQPVAKFAGIPWSFSLNYLYHEPRYLQQPERTTMEDGRIRLTISNYRITRILFSFYTHISSTYFSKLWLSQAAHVFHVLGTPREEWEGYTLYKWISIQLYLHPNINDNPRRVEAQFNLNECYLFVLPPPQLPDTAPDVAAWLRASAESLYYWSLDPTGDSVMPETQRVALRLPSFYQSIHPLEPTHWTVEVYDLVRQWQEAQGFDPTTTDFARSLCYPILEILPQNGSRLEDCVEDDENSKSEPELEGMEVDDCSEMNFSSQDASFSREPFQESSMDVDMEDCINLMANLHVEVTPMDE
ncbi:hypothetical protein PM082_016802 [Marasmius tenuissimus]|nr:hypothetical protein PM082_016802 [Marasmius tenuissimus]